MSKVSDFHTDLKVGHEGEERFAKYYPEFKRTDGRSHDLVNVNTGETVEVKFETRTSKETPNFFVEYISNESKMSPGGPWQSKADYFCFWFSDDVHFVFRTEEFRDRAEQWIEQTKRKPYQIPNKGYFTLGYPMPRKWFQDLEQSSHTPSL